MINPLFVVAIAAKLMTCQALADSQMQPVYIVGSNGDGSCRSGGLVVAYSWTNERAIAAVYPAP